MPPKTFSILRDLNAILAEYTGAELLQAGEYRSLSPALKRGLLALAEEAGTPGRSRVRPERRHAAIGGSNGATSVAALLDRAGFMASTKALATFARDAGLKLQPRDKEGKARFCRRLVNAVETLPEPRRAEVIGVLAARAPKSQTEGWADVIHARP